MAAFARTKRTKSFSTCSGFLSSANEPQVFTMPTRKNRTRRASAMPCTAPWMVRTTSQMPPPLKSAGEVVSSPTTSPILSFHVFRASSRFRTTQLSDSTGRLLSLRG